MKIENLYVTEGLKFGSKEIQELKLETNKIMIGIEYEFLSSLGSGSGSGSGSDDDDNLDSLYNLYSDEIRNELENHDDEIREEVMMSDGYEFILDSLNAIVVFNESNDLGFDKFQDLTKLDKTDLPILRLHQETLKGLRNTSPTKFIFYDDISDFDDRFSTIERTAATNNMSRLDNQIDVEAIFNNGNWFDAYDEVLEDLNEVIPAIESNGIGSLNETSIEFLEDVHSVIDWWDTVRQIWTDVDLFNKIKHNIEIGYDDDELARKLYGHDISEEIQSRVESSNNRWSGSSSSGGVEDIHQDMHVNGMDMSKIESYHTEHDDMVEFVTYPMPMMKSIEYMKKMFKYIKDSKSSTPSFAGMHVNISVKGRQFVRDNFDVLKLFILLDEKFTSEGDKYKKFLGFSPRSMVQKVLNPKNISYNDLLIIAQSKTAETLIHNVKAIIQLDKKYQALNFRHIFTSEDSSVERQRIEVRFFGGQDYHEREVEIEWQIYRLAYMVEIAFNPEFEREEYLRKLVKFLDQATQHYNNVDFAYFARMVKGGNILDLNQGEDLSKDKISKRPAGGVLLRQEAKRG